MLKFVLILTGFLLSPSLLAQDLTSEDLDDIRTMSETKVKATMEEKRWDYEPSQSFDTNEKQLLAFVYKNEKDEPVSSLSINKNRKAEGPAIKYITSDTHYRQKILKTLTDDNKINQTAQKGLIIEVYKINHSYLVIKKKGKTEEVQPEIWVYSKKDYQKVLPH